MQWENDIWYTLRDGSISKDTKSQQQNIKYVFFSVIAVYCASHDNCHSWVGEGYTVHTYKSDNLVPDCRYPTDLQLYRKTLFSSTDDLTAIVKYHVIDECLLT